MSFMSCKVFHYQFPQSRTIMTSRLCPRSKKKSLQINGIRMLNGFKQKIRHAEKTYRIYCLKKKVLSREPDFEYKDSH
jgi:hypothetical protein